MPTLRCFLPILSLAVLVACTGDSPATSPAITSPPAAAAGGVDPLVPYSPAPTPFQERTTGFIPDTLTLPTSDGGKRYITAVTTSMTTELVDGTRALTVYLTVENPGADAWSAKVGADAEVKDLNGKVFPAVPPAPGDLHPDPKRYGGSNRDLSKPVTVPPNASIKGALVFHVTEGNRPITLRISLDGGVTWAEWATNLGVF
jgi:hypothetical protein